MTDLIASNRKTAIVGMGATGLSVARFLSSRNENFIFVDSRQEPPQLQTVRQQYPDAPVALGDFDEDLLCSVDRIVVSPGVSLQESALQAAAAQGIQITGDVELFFENAKAPTIAITGSNGKSTVTTLVGEMAKACGLNTAVGGNLGTPMLDLLNDSIQLYVLELSSFQLELLNDSRGAIATVLNISADHMDRYAGLPQYHAAKHRIFRGAGKAVVNRQDLLTRPLVSGDVEMFSFGLDKPDINGFGLLEDEGQIWISHQFDLLMPVDEVALKGRHNLGNALAALALGKAAGLSMPAMLDTLKTFTGLAHRCETVAEVNGVLYIDDSKGTNVGATLAALNGFGIEGRRSLILIAGGQGKGQDFTPLREPVGKFTSEVILLGEDAHELEKALQGLTEIQQVTSMQQAVEQAHLCAGEGDIVLLSPACASFDMFSGFVERGLCFQQAVKELGQ